MPISIQDLPYSVTKSGSYVMPKGDPTGTGIMIIPWSSDFFHMANVVSNQTAKLGSYYTRYYYPMLYKGQVYTKRFNIRDSVNRKNTYDMVKRSERIKLVPVTTVKGAAGKNIVYDISGFMNIFDRLSKKMKTYRYINAFWDYFKWMMDTIENETKVGSSNSPSFDPNTKIESVYPKKILVLNAADFPFVTKGDVANFVRNPLYLIYYTAYRYSDKLKPFENYDLVILGNKKILKVKLSDLNRDTSRSFKNELMKLERSLGVTLNKIDDTAVDKDAAKDKIASTLQKKYNLIGDDDDAEITDLEDLEDAKEDIDFPVKKRRGDAKEALKKSIESATEAKAEEVVGKLEQQMEIDAAEIASDDPDTEDASALGELETEDEIDQDASVIDRIYRYNQKRVVSKTPASSARDEALKKEQEKLKIGGMTLKQLSELKTVDVPIPKRNVTQNLHTTNEHMKEVKFCNFEKSYNQTALQKDIMGAFESLNHMPIPMHIIDVKIEDTSDELNYKDTYHVTLEDEDRQRHTLTVDIPKFYDDKFLLLGGNKKIIIKQNFMYPCVKTGPDTVQIVTNYNKLFIRRIGSKSISSVERMKKIIKTTPEFRALIKFGNNSAANSKYVSTVEYDELAKFMSSFKCHSLIIYFNRDAAEKKRAAGNYPIPEGYTEDQVSFIGTYKGQGIWLDNSTQMVIGTVSDSTKNVGYGIIDYIFSVCPEEIQRKYALSKAGKRLLYNTATIMAQNVPLGSLLCYWEGITKVLQKMGTVYRFQKTLPRKGLIGENYLKFADGYLVWRDTLESSLILNGLNVMDTSKYNFEDFDKIEPYADYFKKVYGKVSILNALSNAYDWMIDNITLEILQFLNLPTDIVNLCIHGSNLLADNGYAPENRQYNYRVRSNEIVPAILYSELAKQYTHFRASGGKKKLSLRKDCVIKELLGLKTVDDYSTLNPIVELDRFRSITCKGFRGANLDDSYTIDKRQYDPTMMGIMAMSTSPDANVGVVRTLSLEPKISTIRGYCDITEDPETLTDVEIMCPAELTTSLGAMRDDSNRTAMATKQTKHVIPTRVSQPALISHGMDDVARFNLSSDFAVNADEDGEVVERNDDAGVMVVKYKSGKTRGIDLSNKIVKNGAGGFFLSNELISPLKVGDKFKAGDPLALHKNFFSNSKINGPRMNVGPLVKVALVSTYNNYEDGNFITKKLSEMGATEFVFKKTAVIGKHANITQMCKIGDSVEVGDPIISFDTSYEEQELNSFLANIQDSKYSEVLEQSSHVIHSKYSGKIIDIKIYATVDLEEMSDSLRNLCKKYYAKVDKKKRILGKYDKNGTIVKCGVLLTEPDGKISPNQYGVIKGTNVEDSVLIEFYISHIDELGVGDKIVMFTALKTVISEVVPEGYEPYSEYRPDEEISATVAQSGLIGRQTPSIILTIAGNKVLVELKRKILEIYNS